MNLTKVKNTAILLIVGGKSMKKYYLKWTIRDLYEGDLHSKIEVDKPRENIYDYPEIKDPGGIIELVEVDTETCGEKTIQKYAFINLDETLRKFGKHNTLSEKKKFVIYIDQETTVDSSLDLSEVRVVDFKNYRKHFKNQDTKNIEL